MFPMEVEALGPREVAISLIGVVLLVRPREYLKEGTQRGNISPSGISKDDTTGGHATQLMNYSSSS
jgi:hypothetical protein